MLSLFSFALWKRLCVLSCLTDLDDGPGDANTRVDKSDNGDRFRHLEIVTNGGVDASWFP